MPNYIAAIDQGTTSTRCMLFDHSGSVVGVAQQEHQQIYPQAGWVEHDPAEVWTRTQAVIKDVLAQNNIQRDEIAAIGITNQRETSVIWDKTTGQPLYNAIVWMDTRTAKICNDLARDGGQDRFRTQTGLPIATYFSAPKIRWILENVPEAQAAVERGNALFGTMDTWIIWNLTGGVHGGVHVTDVTNASRIMLMDLKTLDWSAELLRIFKIPRSILPTIHSSSEIYANAVGDFAGIPVAGDLGDQQAATVGQTCFERGEAKNTYGTGNFMLSNTGPEIVQSNHGLLTTLCYKFGDQPAIYALEGSIAITGALVQWVRDNLGLIQHASEIETLAQTVEDNGGAYFVPAFSGLYAPYWRNDARGVIVGLTRYVNKGHLARAVLEATAFQTREVLDAMEQDSGVKLSSLRVDGGMVSNATLMQFQADILGVEVIRPKVAETTALGAAYAAGLAVGFWRNTDELRANWQVDHTWQPTMDETKRATLYHQWKRAVERTFDWIE